MKQFVLFYGIFLLVFLMMVICSPAVSLADHAVDAVDVVENMGDGYTVLCCADGVISVTAHAEDGEMLVALTVYPDDVVVTYVCERFSTALADAWVAECNYFAKRFAYELKEEN